MRGRIEIIKIWNVTDNDHKTYCGPICRIYYMCYGFNKYQYMILYA